MLDVLGGTLLELVHGEADSGHDIGGIVIHDPLEEMNIPLHALVLGVGMGDPGAIVTLLDQLGRRGAVGLVLRVQFAADPQIRAAADASGVAVLGLTRGASWEQLSAMLRSLLAQGDIGVSDAESIGGMPAGDLFALANAISALLDAPITIEDRSSRVVAFSGRQSEADPPRFETILGRQVPERYSRILNDRGVFRDLYSSSDPVRVAPVPTADGTASMQRVAVAVRAGDEILGSIWAAAPQRISDERVETLREAAKLAALHLLRVRAGADVERRLRTDLLSTALEGGAGARAAMHRLGLGDEPVVVFALAVVNDRNGDSSIGDDPDLTSETQQLNSAFAMHLSAVHPRASAALIGNIAYGLLPTSVDGEHEDAVTRIALDFLDRLGDRVHAVVGIGPVARDVSGIAAARVGADRALRVAREGRRNVRVARLSDVQVDALLLELRDAIAARGDEPSGSIARLIAYDATHDGTLVETLRAWLDAFGDVNVAAAAMFVHPSTFRYRLRRVAEIGDLDLDDTDARFVAMLQLRVLWPPRSPPPRPLA